MFVDRVSSSFQRVHQEEEQNAKYGKRHGKKYVKLRPFLATATIILLLSFVYFGSIASTTDVGRGRRVTHHDDIYARAGALVQRVAQQKQQKQQHHKPKLRNSFGNTQFNAKPKQNFFQTSLKQVQDLFHQHRVDESPVADDKMSQIFEHWKQQWDLAVIQNQHGGIRWTPPYLLPGMDKLMDDLESNKFPKRSSIMAKVQPHTAKRMDTHLKWQDEWQELVAKHGGEDKVPGPPVDYTNPSKYHYPTMIYEPPTGGYPHLKPLGDIMQDWDQDEDFHGTIQETLLHFDFQDPEQLQAAMRFRDAMLPFKLYNVPEVARATELWTDEYVAEQFDEGDGQGKCQESTDHFFCFYNPNNWPAEVVGMPPERNNDYTFAQFAKHARYADATRLDKDQPHFYWQSGADAMDRLRKEIDQSFISRDLPSFSSRDENFILFHPDEQKGIQCRFGERGVAVAQHYDSGRNMIAMINGAKRYILSPPNSCGTQGLFSDKKSPMYRHSALNYGHIKYLSNPELVKEMPEEEREWLKRVATTPTVETVLKAGEILYLPSFWFHYIVSIQKSAQCNVRSGIQEDRHPEFGGKADVVECSL